MNLHPCLPSRQLARRAGAFGPSRPLVAGLVAFLAFFAAALQAQIPDRITRTIDAAEAQPLAHHHPLWAIAAHDAGAVPADQEIDQMTLVLAHSSGQEQAMEQMLAAQQDPTSPLFHRWLTPVQVGSRFGLSDHDIAALTAWLDSQGLRVNWVSPSRLFIGFGGTAANIGHAFETSLHYYNVNGERRMSVASDPMIPSALAPAIQAIRGLYSVDDHPAHHAFTAESDAPQFSSGGNNYIAPADFATIYNLPANLSGAGVTIGIVGWSFVNPADLDNFREKTGTSFPNPTEVVPTAFGGVNPGSPYTTPTTCSNCLSGQEEATLDVTRAGSVAQDANLLLVSSASSGANDGVGADAQYLIQTTPAPAQIVNISFGDCESDEGSSGVIFWNTLFEQAAAEGISVFVSSGDSGAAGCDNSFATPPGNPAAISPNYICSSTYATCVGGTEFNDASDDAEDWQSANNSALGSAAGYLPEGGWNDPLNFSFQPQVAASGGGASKYIGIPSWQKAAAGAPASATGRLTPDVAFAASCNNGYFGCMAAAGGSCASNASGTYTFELFCGTSATTPGMAGIAALLDQKAGKALGELNPAIYQLASTSPGSFHDVTAATSGVTNCSVDTPSMCNNSIPSSAGLTGGQAGYLVGAGYDEVTGLGSLNVGSFLNGYPGVSTATAAAAPAFSISGTALTLAAGAHSGNTSSITIVPSSGFTGTVVLSAQVTSPAGTADAPTLSFGSTSPVTVTGPNPVTATLTISTAARPATSASLPADSQDHWRAAGGAALACLLLFWTPRRRRNWLAMAVIFMVAATGMVACTAGVNESPAASISTSGTAAGTYLITVTGTSGSTISTGAVTVTVQ